MTFRAPRNWVGPTPWEDIKAAFERVPQGMYTMELSAPADVAAAKQAWSQGIDSRLEAITSPSTSRWLDGDRTRVAIALDITGLLVFLRRLYEDGEDASLELRSAVLASLSIEEE
jgi:hypothetical protein